MQRTPGINARFREKVIYKKYIDRINVVNCGENNNVRRLTSGMNIKASVLFLICLCLLLSCSSTHDTKGNDNFIKDRNSFVAYFSLNISSHLSTYSELSVIEAVQNLARFKDIRNAWIIDRGKRIVAVLKSDEGTIGDPFEELWLLPEIEKARKAREIIVAIKRFDKGVIYTFVSPLFDRVYKRYLGAAIVQYVRR